MKTNKRIIHVLVVLSSLFFAVIVYLTYFQLFRSHEVVQNPYNRRQAKQEENILRGTIYDRNKTVLADSTIEGEEQKRLYPYGALYSHVIGYNSKIYGKSLLEFHYNKELLGINEFTEAIGIKTPGKKGNHLYLTLDHALQKKAEELIRGKNGAVVAMDPETGEVLAMVSKPDFNPTSDQLAEKWRELAESESSPFLPRAFQGLYAPGSTYKTLMGALAIENGMTQKTFDDRGTITIDGKSFQNFGGKSHGTIDLKKALTVSSNTYFAQLGVDLGEKKLQDIADRIGIGEDLSFDLPASRSRFNYDAMHKTDMASVAMGQGKIMVSPLHMAMITSGIANDGWIMQPLLVDQVISPSGKVLHQAAPSPFHEIMKRSTALKLTGMMEEVVRSGTGKNAQIQGIRVAGKTGTAENELSGKQKDKDHAWFIGFAPADNPEIAVAVIVEYSGSTGGSAAAPIARDVMATWLKRSK